MPWELYYLQNGALCCRHQFDTIFFLSKFELKDIFVSSICRNDFVTLQKCITYLFHHDYGIKIFFLNLYNNKFRKMLKVRRKTEWNKTAEILDFFQDLSLWRNTFKMWCTQDQYSVLIIVNRESNMCIASSPGYPSQHTENRGNLEKFTSCIYLEKKNQSPQFTILLINLLIILWLNAFFLGIFHWMKTLTVEQFKF